MAFVDVIDKLWTELTDIVNSEGLSLYDVERLGGGGLRIFISNDSSAEKKVSEDSESEKVSTEENKEESAGYSQGGVTSKACSKLVRRLQTFFLVEGKGLGLPDEPFIEVSSPGLNRHLRLPCHYQSALGEIIKVSFLSNYIFEGAEDKPFKNVIGRLAKYDENQICVEEEGTKRVFEFAPAKVRRAVVQYQF
jgi:ribosome maturation factor RimP